MNWREIANSWNKFVFEFNLQDESETMHYGYGKRELYKASEKINDRVFQYSFKLTKSVNGGVANKIGNRSKCCVDVDNTSSLEFSIKQKSFLQRLFSRSSRFEIHSNLANLERDFPMKAFTQLSVAFPDLQVSLSGEKLMLVSKYHFRTLKDLEDLRTLLIETEALVGKLSR